jgi:CPA2 family monovalent cation:H+ antiporter-2
VLILTAAIGLVVAKTLIYLPMARILGLSWPTALESGLLLGPCGEFAFIILGIAITEKIVPGEAAGFLLAVVALTMAMLPLLSPLGRWIASSWTTQATSDPELLATPPPNDAARAIVVGYGRVGSLVVDMLARHAVPHIATEINPRDVKRGRNNGHPVFFGDAKSPLFLERCNLQKATALIITIHTSKEIDAIVNAARSTRPDIPIISRARDAAHAQHLYGLGVTDVVPETIEASLQLSEAALVAIGVPTGLVIASIHEKRDEFRAILQESAKIVGRETTHGLRRKTTSSAAE